MIIKNTYLNLVFFLIFIYQDNKNKKNLSFKNLKNKNIITILKIFQTTLLKKKNFVLCKQFCGF